MIRHLLADADVNGSIVAGVIRRSGQINFKSAQEADLEGLHDLEVLHLAAQEGRVLVSHDVTTMPNHMRTFLRAITATV
jgi:ABC-type antimicrobial peptide transport system ATPase subunit